MRSAAPPAVSTAVIPALRATSQNHEPSDWVESPTSTERSCEIRLTGSVAIVVSSETPAPAAAAPSTGRRPSRSSARRTGAGRPNATETSTAPSTASPASSSHRWPLR